MTTDNDKTRIASIETKGKSHNSNKLHLIGKKLAQRYLIEELIGEGGMGHIYRARDIHLETSTHQDNFVAIKVLHEELCDSEEAISLLKDETVKTRSLSHPNIVKVFSASSDESHHFVVMEWVEGETLEQLIKRNKPNGLTQKRAKPILKQLIDALSYAHAKGIIHNDLKPSNVMFDSQGNLKILDFGIAKTHSHEDLYAAPSLNDDKPTSTGYTPTYASPAQLNGKEATKKDDIFSLGCIAYELLTSKHPYNRKASNTVSKDTTVKKPSNCSAFLWAKLKRCLQLDEAKRAEALTELNNELTNSRVPLLAHVACYFIIIAGSFFYINSVQEQQTTLDANFKNSVAKVEQLEAWMTWGGDELPQRLDEIPPQYNVLKEGLLKVHQNKIVGRFEQRVDNLARTSLNTKDYDKAIDIYNEARVYYPDSQLLASKLDSLLTERQSIISDLSYRLDVLLAQARYDEGGENSIENLMKQLSIIDQSYQYKPSEEYENVYKLAVMDAIENDDFAMQKTLLNVGELAFKNADNLQPLLIALRKKESAMTALISYNNKVSNGQSASYPSEDALIFYHEKLEGFKTRLAEIEDYKELMEFDEAFSKQAEIFPDTFEPILLIKDEIASKYISMASQLMKRKMYRTAEKLVERSEVIRKSLENTI